MFYCDPCRIKNNWPSSFSKSQGLCELCKKPALCNDVASSRLPMPEKTLVMTKEPFTVQVKRVMRDMQQHELLMQRSSDRFRAIEAFMEMADAHDSGATFTDNDIHDMIKFGR